MSGLTLAVALALAQTCAPSVAPETLLSLAWTESGLNTDAPHVNRNGTRDFGIAQINESNLVRLGLTRETALDPCRSLAAAAQVLIENYHPANNTPVAQQAALRVTLAAYNAGPRGGPNLGYVRKVEAAAQQVIPAIEVAAGQPGLAAAPEAPPAPPPVLDVTIRPASSGREQVFTNFTRGTKP